VSTRPAHPLPLAELLEYWLGELESERAAAVEEHVFDCDACAAALEDVVKLGRSLVALVRAGLVAGRATMGLVNRFSRDRLNVRQYSLRPGETVQCTVSAEDDLLLARLVLPAEAPARVDVSARDEHGQQLWRIDDVCIDRRANEVMAFLPARPRQADPSMQLRYELLVPEAGERVLATYTLQHTAMSET
jgi:hypothetical protein